MAGLCRVSLRLLFLAALFTVPSGVLSQATQEPVAQPGADPNGTIKNAKSGLAAALRASTRNDPANFVPSVETINEFLTGLHTGPAAEAVVGVEVVDKAKDGATETRHCSGLLLRCDGFFALPSAITSLQMTGGAEAVRQTVRVTLHPGTPREQYAQAYIRHYIVDAVDMTVMKVQGVHSPAARPLLPDQLKPGDEVELVWTDWDPAVGRFSPVKHRKASLGQPNLAGEPAKGKALAGVIPFTGMQEGVPGGATVVGPDGMAIGLLPGASGRHDRFTSFSVLDLITNCVVAAPTTDEEFARLQKLQTPPDEPPPADAAAPPADGAAKPKHPTNDMIDIPGGPVRLPLEFQQDQQDMCAEVIACMPGFKIDRYKVSNKEYFDFWMSIPEKERAKKEVRAALYPVSWAGTDPPFPPEIDDVPVIGVSVGAAQAYARSKGKRLATTYEWTRAVFGPFGDAVLPAWVNEYMRQRQQAWIRIFVAHEQYLAQQIMPRVRESDAAKEFVESLAPHLQNPVPVPRPIVPPLSIPFFTSDDRLSDACTWSVRMVQAETKQLCERWINPLYLLPSGSRPYDTSPYGLMDVLLNGNERVIHSPEPFRSEDPRMGVRPTAAGLGFSFSDRWKLPHPPDHVLSPLTIPRNLTVELGQAETSASAFLLSRRLISSSSQVRPHLREFSPSDSESYSEYRARIYEDMMMALPLESVRVTAVRSDLLTTDAWGEQTAAQGPISGSSGFSPPEVPTISSPTSLQRAADKTAKRLPADLDRPIVFVNHSGERPINNGVSLSAVRADEALPLYRGIYFNETRFYSLLAGLSPFMTREMGRDWAKDPPVHIGPWPEFNLSLTQPPDVFLVANGFRCAR